MIENELQKYAQMFAGCEIRLSSVMLTALERVVARVGDPIHDTASFTAGYFGVRVTIETGEPRSGPERWANFEITDGHRFHRAAFLVPLPAVAGGTWYTTKEAIRTAKANIAAEQLGGSWQFGRLMLERRLRDWIPYGADFLAKTAPTDGLIPAQAVVPCSSDYVADAIDACRAVNSVLVIQSPAFPTDPFRFDSARDDARVTCIVMPRSDTIPWRTGFEPGAPAL